MEKGIVQPILNILCSSALVFYSVGILANGITPDSVPNAALINEGRDLFFKETFNGNGRTCGTCHPANNNFTIDPQFIAKLPDDDPLFVAEFVPALMVNFEKPELMRKAGLILENTNGFGDLANDFTMRAVSHTLALSTSITPPSAAGDDGTLGGGHFHRTGWGGDGSPVSMVADPDDPGRIVVSNGSLRSFATGALFQHFPKTLGRVPGVDFRLATEHELDAMEAFMFSLGRQQEFDDLTTITLNNAIAEQGRKNYMGEGLPAGSLNCNACHFNGGANTNPAFVFPVAVTPDTNSESANRSFAPRVEELLGQPGDVLAQGGALGFPAIQLPFDDGFGANTNLFNVPTVIESGDTGAFFHSNQIETIEGMVAFYATNRNFRDGTTLGAIVPLNGAQLANVAAFVRILNADENGRQAIELTEFASDLEGKKKKLNIRLARSEVRDALRVLKEGRLHFADAVPLYKAALKHLKAGGLYDAIEAIEEAREAMINRP